MTYRELYEKAERQLEKGEITIGEFDEMTKPLDEEIRPHGEWEQVGEMIYKCTRCGWIKNIGLMPYCENCGADMRKEGE